MERWREGGREGGREREREGGREGRRKGGRNDTYSRIDTFDTSFIWHSHIRTPMPHNLIFHFYNINKTRGRFKIEEGWDIKIPRKEGN